MASFPDPFDFSSCILDLDHVSNIGHPCWEFLDPNPNVQHLFNRFNDLFFDGILHNRVDVRWLHFNKPNKMCAGLTIPPQLPGDQIHIYLNINLLRNRLRKEIVEQLLHEMIHAYLVHIDQEDEDDDGGHGPNYVTKMTDINQMTKLNITVTHDFLSRGASQNFNGKDKCYLSRCRRNCQNQVPYFGFIWVKGKNREPNAANSMWIDGCEHEFEQYGDENPKQWLTEWECVTIFNKFITENKIQIKSNRIQAVDVNQNLNDNHGNDSFAFDAHDFNEQTEEISNNQYINYDDESGMFISLQDFFPNLYDDSSEPNRIVCTICFNDVPKGNVIGHLNNCTGLTFSIDQSDLPILMINKSNEN